MFAPNVRRISERVGDAAKVLDVGGWARPFNRADWVLDVMPYETRGMLGHDGEGEERFGPETWVTRDICAREPWPFADRSFDFAVCSHTLEDLRDPIWACAELQRVARAGYIEVPSRLEEQARDVQGPWVGWGHHHWLVDVEASSITFVFKPHILGGIPAATFPAGFGERLSDADRVQMLWWEESFAYRERLFYDSEDLHRYLTGFVDGTLRRRPELRPPRAVSARRLGRRLVSRARDAARARSD